MRRRERFIYYIQSNKTKLIDAGAEVGEVRMEYAFQLILEESG